ncbi:MAG: tryptophan--tRNA ligase [bacterium]|nr:tryptophan--tRNA ligase [bacterium]
MADKKIMLSGVKPTGEPHIGNYFGAMRQFVELQDKYKGLVFVANYHALTGNPGKDELLALSKSVVATYLAIGLDPKKTALFLQSDVPEVTELMTIFNNIISVPYLMRAHAYKDATAKGVEANAGLFEYPVLMAADILLYGADVVPVGQDQKQHLEIARDIAQKFNHIYGETFKLPEPYILENVKTVIGTDGRKMSKSYNNTIPLFAKKEQIKEAVMSIKTDSKGVPEPKDPETCNVFALHRLFSEVELPVLLRRYQEGGIGYKESKEILIENIERFIAPMREKHTEIEANDKLIMETLASGRETAQKIAKAKMCEVREKVGLLTT